MERIISNKNASNEPTFANRRCFILNQDRILNSVQVQVLFSLVVLGIYFPLDKIFIAQPHCRKSSINPHMANVAVGNYDLQCIIAFILVRLSRRNSYAGVIHIYNLKYNRMSILQKVGI